MKNVKLYRNSSIRNSYIQTIPRKKTVFAQKSHDNMITTIEPLEKISRTSLKFDLITVPEFGNIYTLDLT